MPTRICAVCSACVPEPDAQVDVGVGQVEVAEDGVGQLDVVVLARVDERLLDAGEPSSAASTGAAFMKFGRAPTT